MTTPQEQKLWNRIIQARKSATFDAYLILHLVGSNILIPFLVITFLVSRRVKRHGVLINLCIHWILSGVFILLPFYAGQHKLDKGISFEICVIQAAFMSGAPPMWAIGVFMFLWYTTRTLRVGVENKPWPKWQLFVLLGLPYIAECAFAIATLTLALLDPRNYDGRDVMRRTTLFLGYFYCTFRSRNLFLAMMTVTVGFCAAILALQVALLITIYRNWKVLRKAGKGDIMDKQFIIRTALFSVWISTGVVILVIDCFIKDIISIHLYTASVGILVFLVFGTHPDVIQTWFFWRKDSPLHVDESRLSRASGLWQYAVPKRRSLSASMPLTKDLEGQPGDVCLLPSEPPKARPRGKPDLMIAIPSPTIRSAVLDRLVLVNESYKF